MSDLFKLPDVFSEILKVFKLVGRQELNVYQATNFQTDLICLISSQIFIDF